jgi:hypothetical protein
MGEVYSSVLWAINLGGCLKGSWFDWNLSGCGVSCATFWVLIFLSFSHFLKINPILACKFERVECLLEAEKLRALCKLCQIKLSC